MKPLILAIGFFLSHSFHFNVCCQEHLVVGGAITLDSSNSETPNAGTIRWTGTDFEGWNGASWVSLTGNMTAPVTDVDGNTYKTVKIGEQVWMAENLRTPRYRNNQLVTLTMSDGTWSTTTNGAYTWYINNSNNEIPYGKLYNWFAVNDPRGLCPTGWHVPTANEWTTMTDYLGGSNIAGGKMKEIGSGYWGDPNKYATNESGFSGLPGGVRDSSGGFLLLGDRGFFWSSTESGFSAWYLDLERKFGDADLNDLGKRSGLHVRCVKD